MPAEPADFQRALQSVTLRLPGSGHEYTVLISQNEAALLKLRAGDWVRYSPHFGTHESPPDDPVERAYWAVSGCIATLCVSGDSVCAQGYREGVYDQGTGQARTADGLQARPDAPRIDPVSMRP